MRDFTQVVKENVTGYRGLFSSAIRWAPIFATTLLALSQDPRLQNRHRTMVNAAIAYFVTTDDAVPEDEFGPYGYIDDNLVSAYVFTRIARDVGWHVIEDAWLGEEPARQVAQEILDREVELLGHLGEEALLVAGLLDRRVKRGEEAGELQTPIGLS